MGGVQSKRSPDTKAPTLILDATPLIYICKSQLAQHLKVLKAHYNLCTTREVYHEVYIKGLQKRVAEIETLKELFEGGLVEVLTEAQQKETNSVKLEEFQLLKHRVCILAKSLSCRPQVLWGPQKLSMIKGLETSEGYLALIFQAQPT